jgi:hypothetical protein
MCGLVGTKRCEFVGARRESLFTLPLITLRKDSKASEVLSQSCEHAGAHMRLQ